MFKIIFILFFINVSRSEKTTSTETTTSITTMNYFYSYGTNFGDTVFTKLDDVFIEINITISFKFFRSTYNKIYLSTNGLLTFDSGISAYSTVGIPNKVFKGISIFWDDIDIRNGGDIFYRQISDQAFLNSLKNDILVYSLINDPKWAFVFTFVNVVRYNTTSPLNTFQVVLVSNGSISFAIFNYKPIQWFTSKTISGLNGADQINYILFPISNITQLATLSNIGIAGRWILRIDEFIPI